MFTQNDIIIKLSAAVHEVSGLQRKLKKNLATMLKTIMPSLPRTVTINCKPQNPKSNGLVAYMSTSVSTWQSYALQMRSCAMLCVKKVLNEYLCLLFVGLLVFGCFATISPFMAAFQ